MRTTPLSSGNSQEEELTGEEAVRRAASAIVNRSSEGSGKRVRRRSRKARTTPILDGGGLKFHYLVGGLIIFAVPAMMFREKISSGVWKLMHPPAPVPAAGTAAAAAPAGPPPWWFHPEVLALFIGLAIWLYLTPGVSDNIKSSLGLKKDKESRSRRRHR